MRRGDVMYRGTGEIPEININGIRSSIEYVSDPV